LATDRFPFIFVDRPSFIPPLESAISIYQNLQEAKTDGYAFWDQDLCIVFDTHSPISLTGIDKLKHSSSIYIHIILLMFIIHQANRPWLKVKVIHATS
jgi:hypothetical protein